MSNPIAAKASCHCGATQQDVYIPSTDLEVTMCHCPSCRHSTGLLYTTYAPITSAPDLSQTTSHETNSSTCDTKTRYFCSTCGCHIFHRLKQGISSSTESGLMEWGVATGTLTLPSASILKISSHKNVESTIDGGIATWLGVSSFSPQVQSSSPPISSETSKDTLSGHCTCGKVRFQISRPPPTPEFSDSAKGIGYTDLIYPFLSTPSSITSNPHGESWWISGSQREKYLTGTCVCTSCRVISGFEIQSWIFTPSSCINFLLPNHTPQTPFIVPTNFEVLHNLGLLKCYKSSSNVTREFCGTCGATIFWRGDEKRGGLVDLSTGLLDAEDGVRAENWLHWFTGRVSFEEEVESRFKGFVWDVKEGLETWGREKGDGEGGRSVRVVE